MPGSPFVTSNSPVRFVRRAQFERVTRAAGSEHFKDITFCPCNSRRSAGRQKLAQQRPNVPLRPADEDVDCSGGTPRTDFVRTLATQQNWLGVSGPACPRSPAGNAARTSRLDYTKVITF